MSSDPPRLPPRHPYRPWITRLLLFATCVLGGESLVGDQGLAGTLRARRELARASTELTALRGRNELLRQESLRLRHDLRSIEELARQNLGLVRPGEVLVILKDEPK